ncbi:protein O-GlcNAcase-like isoform X1 [Paramormyrops kingsleyae]|uniref:protein O-GlcNAcase-like isoform X1 n=2 Tax=Paramormyrops kingsleyae TaxID=1676925 RepID=UPI003B97838E
MVENSAQPPGETVVSPEPGAGGGFIIGVVEGFYGRPWMMAQREGLFRRQRKWGLKTYLYAPKDDYKHRVFWRELYSVEEAEQLVTLISSAKEHGIEFIYAISPGLDITFSSQKDVSSLKRKLDQVSHFGCTSFALLFDDIDHNMCPADKDAFSSIAQAQASITNEVFHFLGKPRPFLFCPTEYCGTLCYPSVSQSPYLRSIGENLHAGIQVLWTGPEVVSKDISLHSIEEVSQVLKRPPVLWDNIHANDYDQKRLFLGPFKGRPTELIPHLQGVLTNPNCEFECNFIAIHTLATWYKSRTDDGHRDVVMAEGEDSAASVPVQLEKQGGDESLETDIPYSPELALQLALTAWLTEFAQPHKYYGCHGPQSDTKPSGAHAASTIVTTIFQQPIMSLGPLASQKKESDEEPMEMVEEKQEEMDRVLMAVEVGPVPRETEGDLVDMQLGPTEQAMSLADPPTLEDLQLLVDLFYLPYEHGPQAMRMLREFNWLRANCSVVSVSSKCKEPHKVAEWRTRAKMFEGMCSSVIQMFTRLSSCASRTILYDLYPYIWDIKNIISVVKAFVLWLDGRILSTSFYCYWMDHGRWCHNQPPEVLLGGDQETWAFSGGLAGEFQRLLPIDGAIDLFYQPPPPVPISKTYSIRPYAPRDEPVVYRICSEVYREAAGDQAFSEHEPDLIGDRLVGGFLSLSPEYCFVLEDKEGIWGYALGAVHIKPFIKKYKMCWIPSMQEKYSKPNCEEQLSEAQKMKLSFHEEGESMPESFLSSFPSLIKLVVHSKVTDPSVAKCMMGCLLSSLKANGSHGAFCEVREAETKMVSFYSKLGFFEVASMEGFPKDVIIMGRTL